MASEVDISPAAAATWKQIKPMSVQRFKREAPEYAPVQISKRTEFRYWKEDNGQNFYGMAVKTKKKAHGIVRIVVPGVWVGECQYKDGQFHGFMRSIFNNGSWVTGCRKNGQKYGRWTWRNPSGEVFREVCYDSDENSDYDC